jgi:hypothetical protein
MSSRPIDFVNGEVLTACSICGRRRLFPSQVVRSPDRLFRCTDCNELTAFEYDQQIAAARRRRPEPDIGVGIGSQFESTFPSDEDMGFP